jgi:hypothetical protein
MCYSLKKIFTIGKACSQFLHFTASTPNGKERKNFALPHNLDELNFRLLINLMNSIDKIVVQDDAAAALPHLCLIEARLKICTVTLEGHVEDFE